VKLKSGAYSKTECHLIHIKIISKHTAEILQGVPIPPTSLEAGAPRVLEAMSLNNDGRCSWLSLAFHPPKTPSQAHTRPHLKAYSLGQTHFCQTAQSLHSQVAFAQEMVKSNLPPSKVEKVQEEILSSQV